MVSSIAPSTLDSDKVDIAADRYTARGVGPNFHIKKVLRRRLCGSFRCKDLEEVDIAAHTLPGEGPGFHNEKVLRRRLCGSFRCKDLEEVDMAADTPPGEVANILVGSCAGACAVVSGVRS